MDIRKPGLNKVFGFSLTSKGITNYLSNPEQVNLFDMIQKSTVSPNLDILPGGTVPPNPTELVARPILDQAIDMLKQRYDYIIIDTPPILLISDALALVPNTDGVALVCRHQVSYVSDIARAINTLKFAKANLLGVIVNDYKAEKSGKFYGGYKKYYYYNSYSYGSTNPEDKNDDPSSNDTMSETND
jgi:capsular exopolysaccharide synthesis family protein